MYVNFLLSSESNLAIYTWIYMIYLSNTHIEALSQIRICRPPPPSEGVQISWKMPTVLNRMRNHVSVRLLVFGLWLILFTIYSDTPGVPPIQKNVFQKWSNLQERCALIKQSFFSSWVFFFVLLLFFEIW